MTQYPVRRAVRNKVVGNHVVGNQGGRLLTLERLETRCCMDASSEVLLRDAAEIKSSEIVSRPQDSDSPKIVEFRMQLLDLQRNNVETVHVGDQMLLQVYVRDLRESIESNFRFFSAYTNISLAENQFEVLGPGEVGQDFWQDKNQLEQDVGGWVVSPYPNGDGHLVFEVPIRAIADGEATIQTKPLQGQSARLNPITLYGVNDPLETSQVSYQSLPVTVLPKLNVAASETIQPNSPVIVPSQTTAVIPPRIDSPSAVLQPQVTQPSRPDDSLDSPITVQLPTTASDIQQEPELGTANVTDLPNSSLEDLLIADQVHSFAIDSQDSANLDDQLYRDAIGFDPTDFQADGLRFTDLVSAYPSLDLSAANSTSSLTNESSLNIVSKPISGTTLNQRSTSLLVSRQPSQKIIHRMLQRLGAYSVKENPDFHWDEAYLRIPMLQLKLQSNYVRNHPSILGSQFEEFVIPRVIIAESVSGKSNPAIPKAIPLALEADSSRANEAWSAYQRVSMKPMAFSQVPKANSIVDDGSLEVKSSIEEGDAEKDDALNQPQQSMLSWWIVGVLSLATGAWFGDWHRFPRLLGSYMRKRIPSLSKASREIDV